MSKKTLEELQAEGLPRFSLARFREFGGKLHHTPMSEKEVDEHLARFVEPVSGKACICCGAGRAGFDWSITHGAGECYICRWPARAYHYADCLDESGEKKSMIVFDTILQYHPDELSKEAPRVEDAEA